MRAIWIGSSVVWALSASATAGAATGDAYLQRFVGNWKGGGTALLSVYLPAWRVDCDLASARAPNSVRVYGSCRLSLFSFLSKRIDTTLFYNPPTDSYSGTYSVNDGPPAVMSGRLAGDVLTLDVTWPKPVNGHLKAVIRTTNDGLGHLSLTSIDPLGTDGTPLTTSDLAFVSR
ncbi:MAG: hypothetical protein JO038_02455 [Alphaproteobacteria bacterium]|nr:hypothetical protein [Alphaproteobacteria bacterium]